MVWVVLIVSAALLCAAWLGWAFHSITIANWFTPVTDIHGVAEWAAGFDGFSALFGALGFSAVLATLLFQSISLNRQQADIHRQRFESNFFEMLKLLRDVRDEVRFRSSDIYARERSSTTKPKLAKGQAAFRVAVNEIDFWIARAEVDKPVLTKDQIADTYGRRVHARFESTFGPYYRLIYTILRRVREDRLLTKTEKSAYGNLLRSQLTSFEATLAGYNGLATFSKDFASLVEEYRLLKYTRKRGRRILERYYSIETFESRD